MERVDLTLLSTIFLVLDFVYRMISFLNLQKKLSNAQIKNCELTGSFSPDPLRKSIFILVAKDNIDFTLPHLQQLNIFKEHV